MGGVGFVSGEDWLSDDSSFYGDEDNQQQLNLLCENFDPAVAMTLHAQNLNATIEKAKVMQDTKLHNPGEGDFTSRQLHESAEEFVKRLPPVTTSADICDWIWVHNPYPSRDGSLNARNDSKLMEHGQELLEMSYRRRKDMKSGKYVPKQLDAEAKHLQQRITELAADTNVLSGKWMLFPQIDALARVWRLVVESVIDNRLGPVAKVAPDSGSNGERLICVYTKDFRDKQDVLRVLRQLVSIGVVSLQRPIYYKTDAYTMLNIYGKNAADYGLQASLYSSQKMLAEAQVAERQPRRKQSTLDSLFQKNDRMEID